MNDKITSEMNNTSNTAGKTDSGVKESRAPKYLMPAFIAFIALLVVIAAIFMLIMPQDIVDYSAGNTYGNIMNGGRVLEAGGYLFYASDDKGLLKIPVSDEAQTTTTEVISEDKCSNISEVQSKVYYQSGQMLKSYNFLNSTDIAELRYPQVIGSWIYYINDTGSICKMRTNGKDQKDLGLICADGQFYVENTRIYYKGADGCIYFAMIDGSENEQLVSTNVDKFFLSNEYLYYSTSNSIMAFMIYDRTSTIIDEINGEAVFNIFGYNLIYTDGGKIKAVDLSSSNVNREVKEISDLKVTEIYSSATAAYFITDAGEFYKLSDISASPELVNLGI